MYNSTFNPSHEYRFASPTTGGVRYVGIDHEHRLFSRNYYMYNGGWRHCIECRLKDVKREVAWAIHAGYEEV